MSPRGSELAENPPGAALELRGVSVRFGAHAALEGVDLHVAAGEHVGLIGPSGAGKTTLLRLFNAMTRPTSGVVVVGGERLDALSPPRLRTARLRIGFVPQDHGLIPNLRVVHNVLAGRLGRRSLLGAMRSVFWPVRGEVDEVHALLARVGIADKLYERTDRLSGGERQRVAIARALYQRPSVLLADEPVSSVDPARARDTLALMTRLATEDGCTFCASLHNIELACAFFPRLIGLRRGRVDLDGEAARIDDGRLRALFDLEREPAPLS